MQAEIDASIAANADFEHLHDKPYEDQRTVRVADDNYPGRNLSSHLVPGVGLE